ncbi:glycoside hydrolase family 6 protein [Microbacterium sp. BG28]|uniref:glycoside hydrolase family 6 protein n=1 Tax=Microbacterium sp. BG28 TaxID=3097356 RepID=UPI002A5A4198|nr:glycoside hydrolase family 6 protein [Microbacterium sp. BG28]MDY0827932.1 glycoside hydrolase family 6 protein [Microbacterium sp. BG28]
MTSTPARSARPRGRAFPRWLLITVLAASLVIVVTAIGVVGWAITSGLQFLGAQAPGVGTRIVVPEESKASKAATEGGLDSESQAAAEYLAAQPTAYWLTPEIDPIGDAGPRILNLAAEARDQDAALSVVVYGLPERDCGSQSAGGLDDASYATWTAEIGQALASVKDVQKIVVLEPDSLAQAPDCDANIDQRMSALHDAALRLVGVDTWVYLDGGHSNWRPASEMASLIQRVGVTDKVRGFATNVSNYNPTTDEFAYAHEVSTLLGGGHALIDTSRNGAGVATSEWCNDPTALVGDPGGTYGDDVVDTNLWIKPPGESDGVCNGGPRAGSWWPEGSVQLTRNVL